MIRRYSPIKTADAAMTSLLLVPPRILRHPWDQSNRGRKGIPRLARDSRRRPHAVGPTRRCEFQPRLCYNARLPGHPSPKRLGVPPFMRGIAVPGACLGGALLLMAGLDLIGMARLWGATDIGPS